jgi:hypothetical protein
LAASNDGRLVAVPVEFGKGQTSLEFMDLDLVDCRRIADSNGDGLLDEANPCVPIGGFVNALRPVNLAQPLVEAARSGTEYAAVLPQGQPDQVPDSTFGFSDLSFRPDNANNDGVAVAAQSAFDAGLKSLCASWNFAHMSDGMRWDAVWYINGSRRDDFTLASQTWNSGEEGNRSVCIESVSGLPEGDYEIALTSEGTLLLADSAFVGGSRPLVSLTVHNRSSGHTICKAHVTSAFNGWGNNDLNPDERIAPNESYAFTLPSGIYDLQLVDCNGEELDSTYGLDVSSETEFQYPSPAASRD